MRSIFSSAYLIVLILGLQGCSAKRELIKTDNWTHDQSEIVSESEEIVLIADTQIHESRGTASRWFSLAGDEIIPVTIRTGQQVIGTVDILTEVLNQAEKQQLIIHLGDALDVSCETEWVSFKRILTSHQNLSSSSPLIFIPGNHDGFLVGNFYPFKDDSLYKTYYWDNICNAGRAFESDKLVYTSARKESIVEDYVRLLDPNGSDLEKSNFESRCIISNGRDLCYTKYINKNAPWESFVIQLVSIKSLGSQPQKIYGLFIDTSDFSKQPWPLGTVKAGVEAGVSLRQLHAAKNLLNDHLPKSAKYFVAGHHDYNSWKSQSWSNEGQALLDDILMGDQSLRFLITAHTHEGGWYLHSIKNGNLTELNLGSLIDYPIYYRTLKFLESNNRAIGVKSKSSFINPKDPKYKLACEVYKDYFPETRKGYSVKDQETENERLRKYPWIIKVAMTSVSALGHFLKFWKSKHTELQPQLLSYRDVVQLTMPENGSIYYYPLGTEDSQQTKLDKQQVIDTLAGLAPCDTGKKGCSVNEKAHLLLALDKYYSFEAPKETQDKAHLMKFCIAINASADAAKEYSTEIAEIRSRAAPEEMLLMAPK